MKLCVSEPNLGRPRSCSSSQRSAEGVNCLACHYTYKHVVESISASLQACGPMDVLGKSRSARGPVVTSRLA